MIFLVLGMKGWAEEEVVFQFEKRDVLRTRIYPQEDGSRMIVHEVSVKHWPTVEGEEEVEREVEGVEKPARIVGGRKVGVVSLGVSVFREGDGVVWSEGRMEGLEGENAVSFQVKEHLGLLAQVVSLPDGKGGTEMLLLSWSETNLAPLAARMERMGREWRRPEFKGSGEGVHWLGEPSERQREVILRWLGELRLRKHALEEAAARRVEEVRLEAEDKAWREAQPGARDVHLFHWTEGDEGVK